MSAIPPEAEFTSSFDHLVGAPNTRDVCLLCVGPQSPLRAYAYLAGLHAAVSTGAQSYDAASLIASAVAGTKTDLSDKAAVQKVLERADFKSVRGNFKYGNNHFPIQNFYLQEAVKYKDGNYALKTVATIVNDDQDRFHDKCPMK